MMYKMTKWIFKENPELQDEMVDAVKKEKVYKHIEELLESVVEN